MKEYEIQFQKITKNSKDCISEKELLSRLKKSIENKKPLRIKAGFDPTYPDLHLGHLVLLNKLKVFQDLGHEVFFLVGDFTACIGDPSGRDETRPPLTAKDIEQNTETYMDQVFKVLDKKNTRVLKNSSWMKNMKPQWWIELCSRKTVARLLERDDFSKRFKSEKPIYLHEFLYPLIQGWDSCEIKADVEVGGTDQIFNLLSGRELQESQKMQPQCVLTYPLLEGLDGKKKMSKSFGNFIALKDSPEEMFGKVMSLSDSLMIRYYELLFENEDSKQLQKDIEKEETHPLEAKKRLARLLIQQFYGLESAQKAEENFSRVFSKKQLPLELPEVFIPPQEEEVRLALLLKELKMTSSAGEARRLIENGGVRIDSKKIEDPHFKIKLAQNKSFILQAGKRKFLKVKVEN